MNARERFHRIMSYQPVDRLPVMVIDPYESATVDRWRTEGLPENVSPTDFLNMDTPPDFSVNFGPIPAFERRILWESDTEYVERDGMGCTVRHRKEAPAMYYGHIDHPVKSADDWRRYKERLSATTPGRIHPELPRAIEAVNGSQTPVGLHLYPFFFRFGFYLMGMERFLTAFYDTPDLMHEIFETYGRFMLDVIRPLLGKARLDFVHFSEDLAYRNGPHISPAIYRDFWLPHQEPLMRAVTEAGVPIVSMYTSGNCEALLGMLLENGFNCTWPCERNAGMDPIKLRKTFGRDLRMVGGIGHTCLAAGREDIDREIDRLLPLIDEGGFIPVVDDMPPPEVPFANYRYCTERLAALRLGGPPDPPK